MAFLERNANRGSISTGYDIDNSLKFEADNSERLYKTFSSDGDMQTWTISFWLKRTELSTNQMVFSAGDTYLYLLTSDLIRVNTRGNTNYFFDTSRRFSDTSAWYHMVVRVDTTNSTALDRTRLYVNGESVASSRTEYSGNTGNTDWNNSTKTHIIGNYVAGSYYLCGYLAEFHSIDGQSLAPTEFGQTNDNGQWVPKAYGGTYGSNGFYLDFADSGDLGDDESGNGNDFTESNIAAIDQATDTPTNNFCTMNHNARTDGNIRTQEGGTYVTTDGGSGWCSMLGSIGVGAGKWYWEAFYYDNSDADDVHIGVVPANDYYVPYNQTGYYLGNVETNGSMGWDLDGGTNYNQNGSWGNPSRGDKLMVALDMDNYKLYYGINGTWGNSADPANGTGSVTAIESYWMSGNAAYLDFVHPGVSVYQGNYMKGFNFGGYCAWTISSGNADANGYGNFEYAPPTGFYALCTKNLAEYG